MGLCLSWEKLPTVPILKALLLLRLFNRLTAVERRMDLWQKFRKTDNCSGLLITEGMEKMKSRILLRMGVPFTLWERQQVTGWRLLGHTKIPWRALPTDLLRPLILMATETGIHILGEKGRMR